MPNPSYFPAVRKWCDDNHILLMVDEVQTGMCRTGPLFAYQGMGFEPDVMTLAKGLGSGVPIGAVVAHGEAATTFKPGNHGTTFGGNPLAMRAALTTIEVMEEDGLLRNAERIGAMLREGFETGLAGVPGFVEMRGKGLMIGIALDRPCGVLVKEALDAGLVLNVTADTVIRLLPALIFTEDDARELLDTLVPVIRRFLGAGKGS
jgi:acetylornithine aminotransferase